MALVCRSCGRSLNDRRRSWCDESCRTHRAPAARPLRDPAILRAWRSDIEAALGRNEQERRRLTAALKALSE